jgi:hypothetical protein
MNGLHRYASAGNLERVKELVKGGANIEELDQDGETALLLACYWGHHDIVVYLVEQGANVAHTTTEGTTTLHSACALGRPRNLTMAKYLLEQGVTITHRDNEGRTALLYAALGGSLEVIQYFLSSEGGASITETDNTGNTALLFAAGGSPTVVQWLLEYGGAQITDTDDNGASVWTVNREGGNLQNLLEDAYSKGDDGKYVFIDGEFVPVGDTAGITAMLRVMVLHGGPPDSLIKDLAPPFQQIVQDGARLRARLPAYLAQRRALLDAHCLLLPPLRDLVHGYDEPTTTDELWATGLGSPLQRNKRSRPERGQSPERRSARLRQKHQ